MFYVQSGQLGRREEAHHVTMLHVTIPPTPPTSINSPQPPCKQLLLSILQPKRYARHKPARRFSSARSFTFVNKKPPSPTLFSAQKTGKSALDSHKNAYFCGGRRLHRRGQNRGAAVAIAPNREGSKLSTSQIKGKKHRMQWPVVDGSHLYRL